MHVAIDKVMNQTTLSPLPKLSPEVSPSNHVVPYRAWWRVPVARCQCGGTLTYTLITNMVNLDDIAANFDTRDTFDTRECASLYCDDPCTECEALRQNAIDLEVNRQLARGLALLADIQDGSRVSRQNVIDLEVNRQLARGLALLADIQDGSRVSR